MSFFGSGVFLIALLGVLVLLSVKILYEYERAVVFRLGRIIGSKGPGLIVLIPLVDKMMRVDMRTVTLDVPPQDIITKDNVTIKVNAVIYFRVVECNRAMVEVENYLLATSKLSQTTLRSVVGQIELDTLLSNRETINGQIQEILDQQTEPWGVKVTNVEVKQVDLPAEMQRAMAKQAEAERERRAKVIAAQGEFEASQKLAEASRVMEGSPMALQLRYLQTMSEMSSEKTSHTFIPIPLDFMKAFKGSG